MKPKNINLDEKRTGDGALFCCRKGGESMPETSIVITAKDNYSNALKTMSTANRSFGKDLDDLQKKLDTLNKNKATLKVDTDQARKALREAEAAFAATGEAAKKTDLEAANEQYEQARRNLSLLTKELRSTEKAMQDLNRKGDQVSNQGMGSRQQAIQGMVSAFAASGMAEMVKNLVGDAANSFVGSAWGSDAGTMFSSALGSAASGAAIGSMIAPGVGTAVGAALGGAVGFASGALQNEQKKDDAFKSVVQDRYNAALESQQASLQSGSVLAAQREIDQISFATLFDDEQTAKTFLADLRDMANVTPFLYDDLTAMSKVMATYGYAVEDILPLLQKVGDTGAALGLSTQDMGMVATYLGRMSSTNKTTLEYLNPLMERGIPAMEYLSESLGVSQEEAYDMVSKGLIPGAEAARIIADAMGKANEGAMALQSQTFSGLSSTVEGLQQNLDAAMGEGYNQERSKGLQEQIDFLGGEEGASMEEAYRMIGQWKASLENDREEAIRGAMTAMMESDEYQQALAAGDRVAMGRLLAEAQVQGENEYMASDGYQLQLEQEKLLAKNIRENTELQDEYWDTGYVMGQEFSKGLWAARMENGNIAKFSPTPTSATMGMVSLPGGYATGLPSVPYDNFPALLHQGERVLTASEAAAYNRGSSPSVTITGNQFTVREEADIGRIAQELVAQMIRAGEVAVS